MDKPYQPTGQATEPEEPEETIQDNLLKNKKKGDGPTNTNFFEGNHSTLPSCSLQVTRCVSGQIIEQIIIQGAGFNKQETAELFNHSLSYLQIVLELMDKKKVKEK